MNSELKEKIKKLKQGSLFILPTDTVYGLSIKIDDFNDFSKYIGNIYNLKNRDKNKKIILLISKLENIYNICDKKDIDEKLIKILNRYWPGNLTVILKTNEKLRNVLQYDTIGIRMPGNKLALDIIDLLGGYVFTTSANISGMKSPKNISEIDEKILQNCDLIIDDKEKNSGIPSTIFRYTNKTIDILREGNITGEILEEVYNENVAK